MDHKHLQGLKDLERFSRDPLKQYQLDTGPQMTGAF